MRACGSRGLKIRLHLVAFTRSPPRDQSRPLCVKEPLRRLGRISTGSGTGGIARSEDSHGADNLVGGQCGTSGAESLADDRILFQTQRWVLSGGKEPFRFICESDPAE